MDRFPKDAVLSRVAACCEPRELGRLCCVGSYPLQSVALSAWRPLVLKRFGQDAAPGQGRKRYKELYFATKLPPGRPIGSLRTLDTVRFVITMEGTLSLSDGARFRVQFIGVELQQDEVVCSFKLQPRMHQVRCTPSFSDLYDELLHVTNEVELPEMNFEGHSRRVEPANESLDFLSVTAMRADGASAHLLCWNEGVAEVNTFSTESEEFCRDFVMDQDTDVHEMLPMQFCFEDSDYERNPDLNTTMVTRFKDDWQEGSECPISFHLGMYLEEHIGSRRELTAHEFGKLVHSQLDEAGLP